MEKSAKIFVAGSRTLIGAAIVRALERGGFGPVVGRGSEEPDLTDDAAIDAFFDRERPEYVFAAGGPSGGIDTNIRLPADLMRENILAAFNVMHHAWRIGVRKLLYLASSCVYPVSSRQPMRPESLFSGPLEPTSGPYAMAKLSGLVLCGAYRRQHGAPFIAGIPADAFGPGDAGGAEDTHVVTALIRRFLAAKTDGLPVVEVWGTGSPRRGFIFTDDLADACVFAMQKYDDDAPLNLGDGTELSIAELAALIKDITGYAGIIRFDPSRPDGAPRKLLDPGPLLDLGWKPKTPIRDALAATCREIEGHVPRTVESGPNFAEASGPGTRTRLFDKPSPGAHWNRVPPARNGPQQTPTGGSHAGPGGRARPVAASPGSSKMPEPSWPLMRNNITRGDLDAVIEFLRGDVPVLTRGPEVRAFEREWSEWLGVSHSVYVNSGASANLLTIAAIRETYGPGEVIVSPLNWASDITAIIQAGCRPVFVDIDRRTLGMRDDLVLGAITPATRAVLLTHIMGFSALTRRLLDELKQRNVILIEDACESHGTLFEGRKVGSFGLVSNFSFYYAHHLSTIEGGMVCTSDPAFCDTIRMMRSHGLVREAFSEELRRSFADGHPDLNPEFIFACPGYNMRPNEIGAVIGRAQLKRLDLGNAQRTKNFKTFLENLDPDLYQTDFAFDGSSNYAFTLVLAKPDDRLCGAVMRMLRDRGVEFRRGTSGGGNQLRQPYARKLLGDFDPQKFPNIEHVHRYGFYIGNYPDLQSEKILELCRSLNDLGANPCGGNGTTR